MNKTWTIRVLVAAGALAAALAQAQTLRFGLAEDPDILDPTLARTFVGRIVFAALCSTSCRSSRARTSGRRTTRR